MSAKTISVKRLYKNKTPDRITVCGDVAYLGLTKGYVTVIDACDVERVKGRSWNANVHKSGRVSVQCMVAGRCVMLHRLLMDAPDGVLVDHKDGDALNNRRSNLRFATHAENMANSRRPLHNTTGFKGVSRKGNRFFAQIQFNKVRYSIGLFATAEEAHAAYCARAKELAGEFARAA